MDHLIEQIIAYMQPDIERLIEEHDEGTPLRECPSYLDVKVCCDAIKSLNRVDGRYDAYTSPGRCLRKYGVKN